LPALASEQQAHPKQLYAVDAGVTDLRVLTDPDTLLSAARAAVTAGGGHVLDEALAVFPNGAVTLVLVLAESHLSIHTWPEERLVAVDLFSCGAIDGASVIASLRTGLGLCQVTVRQVRRGVGAADGG
jgi:S-adenosylmethionine decarboxylase